MIIPTQYMPYFLIALIVIMLAETLRAFRRYKTKALEPPADTDNRERITDISDVISRLLFLVIFVASFIYSVL
jgi:putative copper export protein